MSMTLKTKKNLCFGLIVVFKTATRRSTIDVRKKSDLSWKNRTTGPPGHVRKISDQPQPGQLELWKSETSQFRSDVVFDIVNYVHLIFFHGSKCCFEIFNEFRLLCCLNFMGQECAGIAPESSRFWQHFYAVFTSTETIFCPTSLTISGATWAPTRLGPIKL